MPDIYRPYPARSNDGITGLPAWQYCKRGPARSFAYSVRLEVKRRALPERAGVQNDAIAHPPPARYRCVPRHLLWNWARLEVKRRELPARIAG